ncbi:hypothetical protein K440DRAFT_634011 [Wilcoxina mikolae CBS 423.85]|nr:hypothetical protein K440DRAFT_634011 [Wilcoxina mikolae CBS 423.85]
MRDIPPQSTLKLDKTSQLLCFPNHCGETGRDLNRSRAPVGTSASHRAFGLVGPRLSVKS